MPELTESQRRRRRDAIFSALLHIALTILSGCVLLYLRARFVPAGVGSLVLLGAALIELGISFPILYTLTLRLKEIEGGEEDAAAQY